METMEWKQWDTDTGTAVLPMKREMNSTVGLGKIENLHNTPKESTMSMTDELKLGLLEKAITIVEHESFTDWNSKRKAPLYSFKRVMKVYNQLKAEFA